MITKTTFVALMNTLDEYWNDKAPLLSQLGIEECYFHSFADNFTDALDREVDPKRLARYDKYCYDCGSFIIEWLLGDSEFQEVCKTAEELYDYIMTAYELQLEE